MELFGQHGFKGTSIAAIERASGLAEGAGGIYHHFPSKHALLEAGITRQLSRLDALRDIRRIFIGLDDLEAELTVLARYALAEIDHEADLLRVVLSEARNHPDLVGTAIDVLVGSTYESFAGWLRDRAELDQEQAAVLASVGLGALFSARLLRLLLGRDPINVDEDVFVDTWVRMIRSQIP